MDNLHRELAPVSDAAWAHDRTRVLTDLMARARVEDLLVETDERTVGEIANEVLDRLGWP